MNYSTLKADIAAYLSRTDLDAVIPGFIERAEAFFSREVMPSDMETSDSGTTAGGLITLPADFGELRRLTVTAYGIERTLDYKTPHDNYTGDGSAPVSYAFEGGSVRLFPEAGTGYPYVLYYKPKITPLSDSNPTNWLTDNAPDLYLYASALEGAKHIRDTQTVQEISAMLPSLLDSVRGYSARRGKPSLSGLRVQPRGVIGRR